MNELSELQSALPRTFPLQSSEHGTQRPTESPFNRANLISRTPRPPVRGSEFAAYQAFQEWLFTARPNREGPQLEGSATGFLASTRVRWESGSRRLEAEIRELKAKYVFRNESAITQFVMGHRAASSVLLNALPELKKSFGEDVVFNLEAASDEDESTSLYAIVVWRGLAESAESALEDFDDRWWLNQSPQPGLTFTYELA